MTAIVAGGDHTCALVAGGTVKCWGDNLYGQLGDGTTTPSSVPVSVSGLTGAIALAAGGAISDHSCALISGGAVKCWGRNLDGQLGNASNTDSPVPVTVSGLSGATALTAASAHSCALASGAVQCWGANF